MTKLLITTKPDDTHAICVKEALEKQGHQADLWYTADYPTKLRYSYKADTKTIKWIINGTSWNANTQYDVIWYRRPAKPVLPNYIHPDDINNVRKENVAFMHSLWQTIYPNAKWINPVNAAVKANSKILQLNLAMKANLKTPNTLISNDPRVIKTYMNDHIDLVYKSLHPMIWLNKEELRLTYTSSITLDDLPNDKILQCAPGIFQEKVPKKHEVRATYFGGRYIAVKINSQEHSQARNDWRAAPTKQLSLEQILLPTNIDCGCKTIMRELGIVFGCFDFIVTPDNEYYFLEVNEQGQFLWIEEVNPNIKMLDTFCDFVTTINKAPL